MGIECAKDRCNKRQDYMRKFHHTSILGESLTAPIERFAASLTKPNSESHSGSIRETYSLPTQSFDDGLAT